MSASKPQNNGVSQTVTPERSAAAALNREPVQNTNSQDHQPANDSMLTRYVSEHRPSQVPVTERLAATASRSS
ncbi:hypothetical protein VFPPC_14044 [Pochonia chlamydosporia 170]|uniref:Uncharacterized protein n=1 Tax=Pochonia chlamydosporia 170 TaxID=1380566 RepID=A0A179FIW7_METCM|nr:hypothetical protein VFPPC_14044 [Pochonia chlamydosporia 170]OAQ65327.1 hypothetical protein VFPPC_14044 [Pochonia chlamydosporia 170]